MLELLIHGLCRGAVYALVALGYTMVYGILGLINFAHGEVVMLGMFACVYAIGVCTALLGPVVGWNLVWASAFAVLAASAIGYLNERLAYRRLRFAHKLAPFTSAVGMSIVLQNFIMLAVTKDQIVFPFYDLAWFQQWGFRVAGTQITGLQIMILSSSIIIMGVLFFIVQKTKMGLAMRAVAQDSLAASLMGVPIQKMIVFTFVLGSALAGWAAVLVASYNGVMRFDSGYLLGLKAFTAAVLGGIGNIPGAVLGGFLIGLTEDATSYAIGSDWKNIAIFIVLMVVLVFRPRGLLGERVADKV